jgi:hypothetical protein
MAVAMGARRSGRAAALRHHSGRRTHPQNPMNQDAFGLIEML